MIAPSRLSTEQLESRLCDMETLLKPKFGNNACEDADNDSSKWTVTRRAAFSTEQLESRICVVKAMFKPKFGNNAGEDSDNNSSRWTVTRRAAFSTEQLVSRICVVKAMFKPKFGNNAREDSMDAFIPCRQCSRPSLATMLARTPTLIAPSGSCQ